MQKHPPPYHFVKGYFLWVGTSQVPEGTVGN